MSNKQNPFEPKPISLLELALAITEKNIVKGVISAGKKVYSNKKYVKKSNKRNSIHRDEDGNVFYLIKDNMHAQGFKGLLIKNAEAITEFEVNVKCKSIKL